MLVPRKLELNVSRALEIYGLVITESLVILYKPGLAEPLPFTLNICQYL